MEIIYMKKTNFQKGFSIMAVFAAIAAFFTGAAHVAPVINQDATTTISTYQTFTNSQFGFSFQYPEGFSAQINDGDGSMSNNMIWVRIYCTDRNSSCGSKEFRLYVQTSSSTLNAFVSQADKVSSAAYEGQPSVNVKSSNSTTIAGLNAIQRDETMNAAGFETMITYLRSGNNIYTFSIDPDEKGQTITTDNMQIYNNILSSFKFVTPVNSATTSNSDWKTYTNTQYGFQIQYPANTVVTDVTTEGGQNFSFKISNSRVMDVMVQSNVLNGAYNQACNMPAGVDSYPNKLINGVSFINLNADKFYSADVSTNATEYCVMHNGIGYVLVPLIQHWGSTNLAVDVNNDSVLNQMLSSFKFINTPTTSTSQSITVLSPNGGEVWVTGSTHNITWSTPDMSTPITIQIENYIPPCTTGPCPALSVRPYVIIQNISPNSGSYLWIAGTYSTSDINTSIGSSSVPHVTPQALIGQYSIQVCQSNNCDTSDNYFTITN